MNTASHQARSLAVVDFDEVLFSKIKDPQIAASVVDKINEWTGGQVFLTHLICQCIQQYSAQIVKAEGADIVEEIVREKIIKDWKCNAAAAHLNSLEQTVLSHQDKDALLIAYIQILWHISISIDALPDIKSETAVLLRLGLVGCNNGKLYVANAIYASVFDKAWIDQHMPSHAQKVLTQQNTNRQTDTFRTSGEIRQAASSTVARLPVARLPVASPPVARPPARPPAAHRSASKLPNPTASSSAKKPPLPPPSPPLLSKKQSSWRAFDKIPLFWTLTFTSVAVLICFQLFRGFGFNGFSAIATLPHQRLVSQTDSSSESKALFDTGLEHAINGRWLSTLQQFCRIPASSAYFVPAQQQLEIWIAHHPEDLQQAFAHLYAQPKQRCPLVENTPSQSQDTSVL